MHRWSYKSIFIFKKFYSLKKDRYLKFNEMMKLKAENIGGRKTNEYLEEMNIEIHNNTDEEIMRAAIDNCFPPRPDEIRDLRTFEDWLAKGRSRLMPYLEQLCRELRVVLESHHHLRIRLSTLKRAGFGDTLRDIVKHFDILVFRGVRSVISLERLSNYPRYLGAVEKRIDRLMSASRKDRRRSSKLQGQ